MATIFKLLVLALAGASALRVGTPASMKMPVPQDAIARPAAEQCRTDEPCAFFGGGGAGVPEGAKCIFRPNAPCNRKKCQVNKGPCKANHDSV